MIKIAYHADPDRIGSPDGKKGSAYLSYCHGVSAQPVVRLIKNSGVKPVNILSVHPRQITVRILYFFRDPFCKMNLIFVFLRHLPGYQTGEKAGIIHALHFFAPFALYDKLSRLRFRKKCLKQSAASNGMGS